MTIKTETRQVSNFTRVEMSEYGELIIEQLSNGGSDQESVIIEANEEMLPKIRSDIKGDCLYLGFKVDWWDYRYWFKWFLSTDHKLRFSVKLKQFSGVGIHGSGRCTAEGLQTEDCQLTINGSGKITLNRIVASQLTATINGSGEFEISGATPQATWKINGSGEIKSADLVSETCQVKINGSGKATVTAQQSLGVVVNGSGDVRYRGSPRITQEVNGSGKVAQL